MDLRQTEHGFELAEHYDGDWEDDGPRSFTRHAGEEEITVHAIGRQDGRWEGVVVYEVVDTGVYTERFAASLSADWGVVKAVESAIAIVRKRVEEERIGT